MTGGTPGEEEEEEEEEAIMIAAGASCKSSCSTCTIAPIVVLTFVVDKSSCGGAPVVVPQAHCHRTYLCRT